MSLSGVQNQGGSVSSTSALTAGMMKQVALLCGGTP